VHSNNIAHRDIKPDNILLSEEFVPKICDFGSSENFKLRSDTSTDRRVGTRIFHPPEIYSGILKSH